MYGWEPTFESLGKPIPKQVEMWHLKQIEEPTFESLVNPYLPCVQVSSGWLLKQIEEWLLLSSMCAVVCSYCMSHQHLDDKMVNISHRDVWVISHRNVWVGTYF